MLADISDNAVGIVAVFCIFGLPVLSWFAIRYMKHRETMAMLDRGMRGFGPPPGPPPPGMPGAVPPMAQISPDAQDMLTKGIRLTAVGLALLAGLGILGNGPWLIAGTIPFFLGIAQIVIARLSGAAMPWPSGPRMTYQPPPNGASPPGAPQSPSGSYSYRPPETPELRPPSQPPERQ